MRGKDIIVNPGPDTEQHGPCSDPLGGCQIVVNDHKALAQDLDIGAAAAGTVEPGFERRQNILADMLWREHRIPNEAVTQLTRQGRHTRFDRGNIERHPWPGLRIRAREEITGADIVELAFVVHLATSLGFVHNELQDLDILPHLTDRFAGVSSGVPVVIAVLVGNAQAEREPALTQQVKVQCLKGEHHRTMIKGQHHARADFDGLNIGRDASQGNERGIGQLGLPE